MELKIDEKIPAVNRVFFKKVKIVLKLFQNEEIIRPRPSTVSPSKRTTA